MLHNMPYIYLKEEEDSDIYLVHVVILLYDYRGEKLRILSPNVSLDAHDNEKRLRYGHPYKRDMMRSHIKVDLDYYRGHTELWSYTYRFKYLDILRDQSNHSELVQVIVDRNDSQHHHDGSSVGHYGDAD